jgi:SAM-dependent methyltransferase
MIYYPNRVDAQEAIRLYDDSYFQGAEYFDYLTDRTTHEANFRKRVRTLARWLPPGRSVFEIGCAYGLFLDQARGRWRVSGCDIAAGPCRYARDQLGLDVNCGDFLDVPLTPGSVDAFCLWDTIEHLDSPDTYLSRASEILPAGGLIALTTGDIGSWLARAQGPRWRQIHPPTHLWYFSEATLRRTLDRFGFDVVETRHVGISRSVGQIVYSLTTLGRSEPSWIQRAVMASGLGAARFPLNTFDLILAVGRRRDDGGQAKGPHRARREETQNHDRVGRHS